MEDTGAEKRFCPRCGKKMSLVAAGWYCKKDDYIIDRDTGKEPITAKTPQPQRSITQGA